MPQVNTAQGVLFFLVCILAVSVVTVIPSPTDAQVSCFKGSPKQAATQADLDSMQKAGITSAVIGMWWCPDDPHIGQAQADVKQFLYSRKCAETISTGYHPQYCPNKTRPFRVDGMDNNFALCVQNYIKSYEAANGANSICIRDAFRAPEDQICAAANPENRGAVAKPGSSRHEVGQAVDMNPLPSPNPKDAKAMTDAYTKMRMWTLQNEKGLRFRYVCGFAPGTGGDSNLNDCPHVEAAMANCAGSPGARYRPPTPTSVSAPTGVSARTGGTNDDPFRNPYDPTRRNEQMCTINYEPLVKIPCSQLSQIMQQTPQPQQSPTPNQSPSPSSISPGGQQESRLPASYSPPTPNTQTTSGQSPTFGNTGTGGTSKQTSEQLLELLNSPTQPQNPVQTKSSSTPTKLNLNLRETRSITKTTEPEPEKLVVNASDEPRVENPRPTRVTETFTQTPPTIVPPPSTSSNQFSANKSLTVALLTSLRDMLVSFVNILKSKQSHGFHAPWQPTSTHSDE